MRLTELSPRWLSPDVFTFLCPCCCKVLLTCKRVPMDRKTQCLLWREILDWDQEYEEVDFGSVTVILCKKETAWTISSSNFETLTVTPSIDASAAGHWHGFVLAGEIKGGSQLQ